MDHQRTHNELETEEAEFLPWDQLAERFQPARTQRILALLVSLVAVAGVVLVLGPMLRARPGTEVNVQPVPEGQAVESTAITTPVAPTTLAASVAEPTPKVIYTEADLMAVIPDLDPTASIELDRRVATVAEWYVTDHFTTGPPESDTPSWVEWALVGDIQAVGDDLFSADVIVQLLTASADEYLRHDPITVRISIATDTGVPRVVELPQPVAISDPLLVDLPAPDEAAAPEAVVEQAFLEAATLGDSPELVHASLDSSGQWRLVIEVGQGAVRWPIAVRVVP